MVGAAVDAMPVYDLDARITEGDKAEQDGRREQSSGAGEMCTWTIFLP